MKLRLLLLLKKFDQVVVIKGKNLNKEGKMFWLNDEGRCGIEVVGQKDPVWDFLSNVRKK